MDNDHGYVPLDVNTSRWVLSLFTTYYRVYYQINTASATSGARSAYPSGAHEFSLGFNWGSCYSIFRFICMFCRSLFVLLYFFLLTIVLPVLLRYADSDYPFGIFKLFLRICWIVPNKYLLLLDQTILLQFRSSIDRPLNLPQYLGSNNYFSIPEEYIYNQ